MKNPPADSHLPRRFAPTALMLGNIVTGYACGAHSHQRPSAFAPDYASLLVIRLVMLAVGALSPQAAGTAALIVRPEKRGSTIATSFSDGRSPPPSACR